MIRHRLTDAQWTRIENLIPGKPGDPGRTGDDNRLFLDAIVWMARTGAPWRDLHPRFGNWNSVFRRFRRWAIAGVWERILGALAADDPDFECIIIDGTIIRAHQHAAGGKGGFKNRRSGDRAED
jgi:putative transposase